MSIVQYDAVWKLDRVLISVSSIYNVVTSLTIHPEELLIQHELQTKLLSRTCHTSMSIKWSQLSANETLSYTYTAPGSQAKNYTAPGSQENTVGQH